MRRPGWLFIMGPALLAVGCGGTSVVPPPPDPADRVVDIAQVGGATQVVAVASLPVLEPHELCEDYSDDVIATFEDANLETAIRAALSADEQEDLTCGLVSGLTELNARGRGRIQTKSIVGIQNLRSLTNLHLGRNSIGGSITDIGALSGLTGLTYVDLSSNSITDISALSGLASLTALGLYGNSITDITALGRLTSLSNVRLSSNPGLTNIQPLLDRAGIEEVSLLGTNVSCEDVALLERTGVIVFSACQ